MVFNKLKLTLITFLSLAVAACGFHLRGSYDLPKWFNQVYIQGVRTVEPYFSSRLIAELKGKQIKLVSSEPGAGAIINLVEDKLSRSVFATNPATGYTSSYQISYKLKYEILKKGDINKIEGEFNRAENYEFDHKDLFGAREQENKIKADLINQAVNSILSHLARL